MIRTYVAPEQPSKSKAIVGIASSITWAFIISYIYGVIIAVSPLVYFNFFITVGFGLTLGYGVRIISKLSSIIDKKTSTKISLASGALGIYFSWVVYILYFLAQDSLFDSYFIEPFLVFNPIEVFQIITEINTHGLWEIFGIPFNGWILAIIWMIEAAIIMIVSTLVVKNQPQSPFSLRHDKWYKKYILHKDFESIALQENFRKDLATNCKEVIGLLGNGLAYHHAMISIFFLEEENEQYLTVENVRNDKSGKRINSTEVTHLLPISRDEAKELIEKYHGKKAFVFDY